MFFLTGSKIETVAPATGAPFESLTVPFIDAVISCENEIAASERQHITAKNTKTNAFLLIFSFLFQILRNSVIETHKNYLGLWIFIQIFVIASETKHPPRSQKRNKTDAMLHSCEI
jgi:hypothetical protein